MNAALEAVHHGANTVHADAAARNFRDFSGGAEAGLENQVERVLVAHAFGFFRLDNSFFDRVGANQREIYSAAVITDFDHHLSALMIGVQINGAARGLCGSEALFGRAYAVIHGVSNQVHQRLGEGIQKDRKSTRLNSSHGYISYAVFCLKKKKTKQIYILSHHDTADKHITICFNYHGERTTYERQSTICRRSRHSSEAYMSHQYICLHN